MLFSCNRFMWIFICFIFNGVKSNAPTNECKTPDHRPGNCILISDCKFIIESIKQNSGNSVHAATITLLQNYNCGFDGLQAKVCCPISTKNQQRAEETIQNGINRDVGLHKNIRLINKESCGPQFNDTVYLGKHPWMALIAYNGSSGLSFRCGGTLISENYILTAAQCITQLKNHNAVVGVRLGEYDVKEEIDCIGVNCAPPVQDFFVTEIIPHPHYDSATFKNDIGLLRLNKPANINVATVKPICLPIGESQRDTLVGRYAIISGWGVTETGYTSTKLLHTALPVVSTGDCQSLYDQQRVQQPVQIDDASQMCAGGVSGKDSCAGDGGGPLGLLNREAKFVQYGIVSFGSRLCGAENLPGVYTRVSNYVDWILDNMH